MLPWYVSIDVFWSGLGHVTSSFWLAATGPPSACSPSTPSLFVQVFHWTLTPPTTAACRGLDSVKQAFGILNSVEGVVSPWEWDECDLDWLPLCIGTVKLSNCSPGVSDMLVGDKGCAFGTTCTIVSKFGVLYRSNTLEQILWVISTGTGSFRKVVAYPNIILGQIVMQILDLDFCREWFSVSLAWRRRTSSVVVPLMFDRAIVLSTVIAFSGCSVVAAA